MFALALLFGAGCILSLSAAIVTSNVGLGLLAACCAFGFLWANIRWVGEQKEREWK